MLHFLLLVASDVPLATFDGRAPHSWQTENDPVMGGQSNGKWSTTTIANKTYGEWTGECKIVPALKAPGFTIALTKSPLTAKFPDVHDQDGLLITAKNLGNVSTFNVAFCDSRINFYRCQFGSFKANFSMPVSDYFSTVFVPWGHFSDKWSSATGKHTKEDPPTAASLSKISQVQVWVEGVAGKFHVLLEGISAGKAPIQS